MAKAPKKVLVQGVTRPGWSAPLAALLGLAAAAGAYAAYVGLGKTPSNPTVGWAGVATLIVAGGLAFVLVAGTKRELRIDLDGISMRVGFGRATEIRWSEPHDFFYLGVIGSSTPTVTKARLQASDGRRIDVDDVKLDDYPNANPPALVEQHSTTANLSKIKAQIAEGKTVPFGPLELCDGVLKVDGNSYPLADGLVLNIEAGKLEIGADGDWVACGVAVREVANYPCLLRVIGQVTRARAPT